ncbi:hypothetical protein GQ44DRAFT_667713 [Phaeosphaeriaceae sp. PMI808]|nr:hypothetical protein GQ44DRAFT_667713 [Phaeosphaeriaceae sp. PMI808]
MSDHSAIPFDLPDEIWLMIIGHLSASDLKQVRATCKSLHELATPLLFHTAYFELCGRGCNSLYNISLNRALSSCVKTLVLRRARGYREFPAFETWVASIHQPGDPGHEFAPPSDASHYNNKQASESLLPYTEWLTLPETQKEVLYHEYEADRKQAREEVRDVTNTLRFRTLNSAKSALVHPYRGLSSGLADTAVEQFCKALETLPNLTAIKHEPGFLYQDDWACRWRNLYFHPWSVINHTDYPDDEDVEALQLSIVLHSLAWVRKGDRRLTRLSMYVGGPAFATPERLRLLWDGDGHELTRVCRSINRNAAEADKDAYVDHINSRRSKLYYGQLNLMRYAIADLTYLDYVVSDEDELVGSLEIAAKLVFGFIVATKSLERLRLVFGRLVDGILLPLSRYNERQCAQDSIRLLAQLTRHSPWIKIRHIELEIATDRTTLVQFLLAHKDTLSSLTLTRMSLVRLEDPRNNWEVTLAEIVQGLSLKTLTLFKLCDFPQEWTREVQNRMLFDIEAEIWQGKTREYHAYYDAAVGRLLRQESCHSLDPEAFQGLGG